MFDEIGVALEAARQAQAVTARINSAGIGLVELKGHEDVVAAITGKNVFTPFFYSCSHAMAQFWLPDTNINVPRLNSLGGSIIIIDEIAERMTSSEMSCHTCLDLALEKMDFAQETPRDSVVYQALEQMYFSMQQEREYSELRLQGSSPKSRKANLNFEDYHQAVAQSIGMMPFYAAVAEANDEQIELNPRKHTPGAEKLKMLRDLEWATRILADDITLGKDLKNGSLNIISEYRHYHPEMTLEQARDHMKAGVLDVLRQIRSRTDDLDASPALRYALCFVQALESTAHMEDPGIRNSKVLGLMGSLIANFVYRVDF